MIGVNPKNRSHFLTFVICREFNINFKVDGTADMSDLFEKSAFTDILISIATTTDFTQLHQNLAKLENILDKNDLQDTSIQLLDKYYKTLEKGIDKKFSELDIKNSMENNNIAMENTGRSAFAIKASEKVLKGDNLLIFIALCLFSSKIVPGLVNKNQIDTYKEIKKIFEANKESFSAYFSEFSHLKAQIATGTLQKTQTLLKNKEVVTRFPPEPSGYLHLGHAKAALINHGLATRNNGKWILRFDDTNPAVESQEFTDAIQNDLKDILGLIPDKITHTSDYFPNMIEYCKKLISKDLAYCDATPAEQMAKERFDGVKSSYRSSATVENLQIFDQMLSGSHKNYCVRAKIDSKSENKAMRDPVIFRHIETAHPRAPSMKIFPTYDFACPIVDSLEEITHAFRTNEYRDRNAVYNWFLKALDLKHKPIIKDFSKLAFENTVLSKRKLRAVIEKHNLSWDDPRMPTLRGIIKLGIVPEVLKSYIIKQGMTQKNSVVSWDKIWAENKSFIDKAAPRFFGVPKNHCLVAHIVNFPEFIAHNKEIIHSENFNDDSSGYILKIPKNKRNIADGYKLVSISETSILPAESYTHGEEITLMNLGNFKLHINGSKYALEYIKDGDFKKTTFKVQWLDFNSKIECTMIEYGSLFDNDGNFNCKSKNTDIFYCEKSIENLKHGEIFQIERVGFFYKDHNAFNLVPFTKQQRKKS